MAIPQWRGFARLYGARQNTLNALSKLLQVTSHEAVGPKFDRYRSFSVLADGEDVQKRGFLPNSACRL